jgi:hypothetical protein
VVLGLCLKQALLAEQESKQQDFLLASHTEPSRLYPYPTGTHKETTKTRMEFVEYCECYFSETEASFLPTCGDDCFAPHLFTRTGDVRESTLGGVLMQVRELLFEPLAS